MHDIEAKPLHPATQVLLECFDYAHLPPSLHMIAAKLYELAHTLARELPDLPEVRDGLEILHEARECFLWAAMIGHAQEKR